MPRHDARVWLALGTIYTVWGSTFMAVTIAVRDLPPLLAMGLRHVTAGAFLLAWALPRGDRAGDRIGRRQLAASAVFGGTLFLGGHGGLAWAQQTVPSGVAALLIGSIPLWMALLDRVLFGRRLHRAAYAGLATGFVGLAFLVDPFGAGSVDRVGAVAYLVVVGTLIGFSAYVWLLRAAPTSLVGTYAYVNPIVAVLLGWALLGEEITPQMLVAGLAIVVSVALIVGTSGVAAEPGRGLRRRRPDAAPASDLSGV